MNQFNINDGRDQNIFNNPENINVNINLEDSLPRLQALEANYKFVHYVLTLFFLAWNLVIWLILGLFAKSEFPVDYVCKLIIACLKGPESLSIVLNNEQREICNLKDNTLKARRNSKEENSRLNKLSARIITLEKIIQRLYKNIDVKEKSISRILRKLEKDRKLIRLDLEPLRQQYDPNLYKLDRLVQMLLEGKVSAEVDYEQVEQLLRDLSEKYEIKSENSSAESVAELISELRQFIHQNPHKIRKSRLLTLQKTLNLLQWVLSVKDPSYSPNFASDFTSLDIEENLEETSYLDFKEDSLVLVHNSSNVDLREITENPQGEFVDRLWIDLITDQVEKAIKKTTDTDKDTVNKIRQGIAREWIDRVSIYGFDSITGLAKIELALDIDWNNQEFRLSHMDNSKFDSLGKAILDFKEFVRSKNLASEWRVEYTYPENTDFYNAELGFCTVESVEWATQGNVFRTSISGNFKLYVELNFGPPTRLRPFKYLPTDSNPNNGYTLVVVAAIILFLGSLISIYQPASFQPKQSSSSGISINQEQENLNQLHNAISVWDVQTAQRILIPLSQSEDPCVVEFAETFGKSLRSKGEKGFKDINPIKRNLNKKRNCSLKITPYKFSP